MSRSCNYREYVDYRGRQWAPITLSFVPSKKPACIYEHFPTSQLASFFMAIPLRAVVHLPLCPSSSISFMAVIRVDSAYAQPLEHRALERHSGHHAIVGPAPGHDRRHSRFSNHDPTWGPHSRSTCSVASTSRAYDIRPASSSDSCFADEPALPQPSRAVEDWNSYHWKELCQAVL